MKDIRKLLRELKKTCSAFIGHWKRVLLISGQKIRLVCYRLYTMAYEIVFEIVEKPEQFVVRVVFVDVFRFVIIFTRLILVKTSELTRAFLCAVFQIIVIFTRLILVKTSELTRAFLHFLCSYGKIYKFRIWFEDRSTIIYQNPFLEIILVLLQTRLIFQISGKLVRVFASIGVAVNHLDLFTLLLFIFLIVKFSLSS